MEFVRFVLRVRQTPQVIPVNSSRVKALGWQPPTEDSNTGALFVTFTDGTTGWYSEVPRDVFEHVRDAPSIGRELYQAVIKQGYAFTRTQ